MVVVHQRISQLSSSGMMNIETSHKFSRQGDTAYGCIEGVDLELYQVGVEGGMFIPKTVPETECVYQYNNITHLPVCVLKSIYFRFRITLFGIRYW